MEKNIEKIGVSKKSIWLRLANFSKRKFFGPLLRILFVKLGLNARYRILNTNASAIGHLCIDIDCFLKERQTKGFVYKGVLLSGRSNVSNIVLARLWAKAPGILVIQSNILCYMLDYLRTYIDTSFDCSRYCALDWCQAEVFAVYKEYNKTTPLIEWDSLLEVKGRQLFETVFPSVDPQKIVVLQSRDSLFDKTIKNHNYYTQSYRNCDVNSYSEILKYLASRGYSVIRIGSYEGDSDNSELGYYKIPKMGRFETDLLNVYLSSICSVFLGSASGASNLAAIWNKPVFLLNILPYALLRPHYERSMAIPKVLRIKGRALSAKEIFEKNYHWLRADQEYKDNGLEIMVNKPEDCIEDFMEFFNAFVEEKVQMQESLKKSDVQVAYNKICPSNSYDYNASSLVPRNFFKKYGVL